MTPMPMRLFLTSLAIVLAASTAYAQWDPFPMKNVPRTPDGKVDIKAPARRTPDGKPDLQGFWMPTNPVKHLLNLAADLKPGEVPLQPWAAALYQERIDNNGKDHPGARCLPSGIPEKDNIPDGLKVVQTPDMETKFKNLGTIPHSLGPPDFAAFLDKEDARWSKIVKQAGVTVE